MKHTKDDIAAREHRRRSVKRILATGGLAVGTHLTAGAWVKPAVESVVLPAHAVTSGEIVFDDSIGDPCLITLTCTGTSPYEYNVRVQGAVVPATAGVAVDIQIAFDGSGSYSPFASTVTDSGGEYQATHAYSSHFSVQVRVTLPDHSEAGTAECSIDTSSDSLYSEGNYYTRSTDFYFCETFGGD
ncbi:MAG: hypothetical protein WAL83_05060 [Arenicellales bacterium]